MSTNGQKSGVILTFFKLYGNILLTCNVFVALINASEGQFTAVLFGFLIAAGQAFLNSALIVHGVRDYYAE